MRIILYLLPLIVLFSCSVQKRKYQNGFYFAGKQNIKKTRVQTNNPKSKTNNFTAFTRQESPADIAELSASASVDKVPVTLNPVSRTRYKQDPDTCDKLIFRDGNELRVKVLEISPQEIRYKKCDMPDGPFYVSRKADIFMVKYANGTKELFEATTPQIGKPSAAPHKPTRKRYMNPKNTENDAVTALILGVVGILFFFYGSIHAIILGRNVIKEVKHNPATYNDGSAEMMARTGVILGIVKLAIFALVVFLSILSI